MLVPILRPLVPSTGQLQAYGPSNTIVISDRAANIDRLVKVIQRMDRADDEELEVVPLKFASAKTLAQTIQTLQQSNIKGVRGKNKVAADERTNSLLLSGDRSARQQVKKIIRKLDTFEKIEEKTKVVYLRYAKAEELAKVLTGFSKTQVSNKPVKKGAASGSSKKPGIDIQADEATNSLIITAEPDVHANLIKVIRKLDVRRAQVLVEAVIAEINVNLAKRLGVSLGVLSSDGILGATGSSVTGLNTLLGLLGSTALPTTAPDGGTFGLMDNQGGARFGALVQALLNDGATNILSTPTVIAMDNEEASLVVGENVPFVTGSQSATNTTGIFNTIEREDVGIKLKITPQINSGDSIRLDIEQEVSSLGASSTAAERITNKREIKTSVMVEDDQVLILGGLMEDSFTDTVTKVPGLGNLPVVGKLFTSTSTEKVKKNLMVFIHPVIMRDVLSADSYTRQKYNKLRRIQHKSGVNKRGILKEKADLFPNNIKNEFIKKLTPQQLKQQQKRQQQLNKQRSIQARAGSPQSRMTQQQRAAAQQSNYRTPEKQAPKAMNRATRQQNALKQSAFGARTGSTSKRRSSAPHIPMNKAQAPRSKQQQQVDAFLDGIE